ncbi:hypothetical protein GGS20DRAFT_199861 [Poronia punctata]|nr:hypothetical protein GGS20DRAFT_199861 [Poronia punctata]
MTTAALLFRIAYNSVYGVLCLILTALLLIVPGDFVRQALATTRQYINLIVIAIVYVLSILIVLFVYAARLYVTRTVLASIPKQSIPIDKGDVNKKVRDMIVASIGRSAAIAWSARPKVTPPTDTTTHTTADSFNAGDGNERGSKDGRKSLQLFRSKPRPSVEEEMGISLPPVRPVWGEIEHYGWGSPCSPDLPNVHYAKVLAELPNLIEAKAVAQAPAAPEPTATLDRDAVMLLQRPLNITLRGYISHLTELDILSTSPNVTQFLDLYERVRFSNRPMSDTTFRKLMHLFAEVLREMRPLSPTVLYESLDHESMYSVFDGHIDDYRPRNSNSTTPSQSLRSSSSFDDRDSMHSQRIPRLAVRNSSATTAGLHYRTAPTTPRSRAEGTFVSRSISSGSAQSSIRTQTRRRNYPPSQTSGSSLGSASQNSVIRLATAEDPGDLPYIIQPNTV